LVVRASHLVRFQLTRFRCRYYYDIIFREADVANEKTIALTATGERPAATVSRNAMLIILLPANLGHSYGISRLSNGGDFTGMVIVIVATIVFILVMPGFYML